jgi:TonB family protein
MNTKIRKRFTLACWIVAWTALILPCEAQIADDDAKAREFFEIAETYYEDQDYAGTLKTLELVRQNLSETNPQILGLEARVLISTKFYDDAKTKLSLLFDYNLNDEFKAEMNQLYLELETLIEEQFINSKSDEYIEASWAIKSKPDYPERAESEGIEGHIVLNFDISPSGRAYNISVTERRLSSTDQDNVFDLAAIKAVQESRFQPATQGGMPVGVNNFELTLSSELPENKKPKKPTSTKAKTNIEKKISESENDTEVFNLRSVDKLPRAIFQVDPNYPYSLKQAKVGGYVKLEWIIDESGKVLRPKVLESSNPGFNQPAIESILKSKWAPAKKNGKPVAVKVIQRMDFNP